MPFQPKIEALNDNLVRFDKSKRIKQIVNAFSLNKTLPYLRNFSQGDSPTLPDKSIQLMKSCKWCTFNPGIIPLKCLSLTTKWENSDLVHDTDQLWYHNPNTPGNFQTSLPQDKNWGNQANNLDVYSLKQIKFLRIK